MIKKLFLLALLWTNIAFAGQVGTGWFINSEGYVITASHVVRNMRFVYVIYKDSYVRARVIAIDSTNDIAILSISRQNTPFIQIVSDYNDGDYIDSYGYSDPETMGWGLKRHTGHAYHSGNDVLFNMISIPGDSGGPIFNSNGCVIGLIKSGFIKYNISPIGSSRGLGAGGQSIINLLAKFGITHYNNSVCYKEIDAIVVIYAQQESL